jgi:hypothetical protein
MVDISELDRALRCEPSDLATARAETGAAMDVSILVEDPRSMIEEDLDWLTYLCKKKYSHRYDPETTQNWFRNIVLKSPLMFYAQRTQDAFVITMLSIVPWLPNDIDANVIFICADDGAMWQSLKLLRSSIEWARKRRATLWRISTDTENNLEMLARRLGATAIEPRFILRFPSGGL